MNHSITLRSGLRAELDGFAYLRESLKLSARALLYRRQTGRWLQLLNSHPLFAQMLPDCPRLVNKIYRDYFSTKLRCDERLALLQTHYAMVIRRGLAPLVARAAAGPVAVCHLDGRADGDYRIELRAGGVLCREGELVLQLMHGAELLYSIAFSFIGDGADVAIGVGCLQGPVGGNGLEAIRHATRDLHGMRPKNLLVRLVRQFGHDLGCAQLILVGNGNRVVTASMRRGKVHADYDSLWEELRAVRHPDGDFGLACDDLAEPMMQEIASKKRSEARKRHAMLRAAIAGMRAQVVRSQRELAPLRLVHSVPAPAPQGSRRVDLCNLG
ncbi:MAG: DUF535 family protein [Pseudomonadota bacterium]|nr:DUF535 family protein [Pseudomonadota bacterium]